MTQCSNNCRSIVTPFYTLNLCQLAQARLGAVSRDDEPSAKRPAISKLDLRKCAIWFVSDDFAFDEPDIAAPSYIAQVRLKL
jgi:hypothetical protein